MTLSPGPRRLIASNATKAVLIVSILTLDSELRRYTTTALPAF